MRDLPWTEEKLREIPPFEFENWAVIALGGIPNIRSKSATWASTAAFIPSAPRPRSVGKETGHLEFMDVWYPIQVKQKDKAGRPGYRRIRGSDDTRRPHKLGFFIAFDYSAATRLTEIDRFFKQQGKAANIRALTVREILDEHLAAEAGVSARRQRLHDGHAEHTNTTT